VSLALWPEDSLGFWLCKGESQSRETARMAEGVQRNRVRVTKARYVQSTFLAWAKSILGSNPCN